MSIFTDLAEKFKKKDKKETLTNRALSSLSNFFPIQGAISGAKMATRPKETFNKGKKIAKGAWGFIQGTLASVAGAGITVGQELSAIGKDKETKAKIRRTTVTPKTRFEKTIFGDKPIGNVAQQTYEFRKAINPKAKERPIIDYPIGIALGVADFISGGGAKKAATSAIPEIVSGLKKSEEIFPFVRRMFSGSDEAVSEVAKKLENVTDPRLVEEELLRISADKNVPLKLTKEAESSIKKMRELDALADNIKVDEVNRVMNLKTVDGLTPRQVANANAWLVKNGDELIQAFKDIKDKSGGVLKDSVVMSKTLRLIENESKLIKTMPKSVQADFVAQVNALKLKADNELTNLFEGGAKDFDKDSVEAFSSMRTLLGRSFRILKGQAKNADPLAYESIVQRLKDAGKTLDEIENAVDEFKKARGANAFKDPVMREIFFRQLVKPKLSAILNEYRYINMLSSPKTHLFNIASNLGQAVLNVPVRLITGAIDKIGSALTGKAREQYMREVPEYMKGAINSVSEAFGDAIDVLKKGGSSTRRPDIKQVETGKTGPLIYILRAMDAGDIFFRKIIQKGEESALLKRAELQWNKANKTEGFLDEAADPIIQEARKYKSAEEFVKAFTQDIKRGQYWHITEDPNFKIDLSKGPRDMSSISGGGIDAGKLMITSDLPYWAENYKGSRKYVAKIDMSNVPNSDFWQTERGMGNEFFVNLPEKARVEKVIPLEQGLKESVKFKKWLEKNITNKSQLEEIWKKATQKSSTPVFKPNISQIKKQAESNAEKLVYRSKLDPNNESGQGKFNSALDAVASSIFFTGEKVPLLRWFVPFVQTPTQVLKQGIEFTPGLGLLNLAGNKRKAELFAKQFIGATTTYTLADMALNDKITWDIPPNKTEREAFYADGRKPYSIKIGNSWIPYNRIGPAGFPIGLIANIAHKYKYGPKAATAGEVEKMMGVVGGMLEFFSDQSFLQGVGDILQVFQEGDDLATAGSKTLENFSRQVIPLSALFGWVARLTDDYIWDKREGFPGDYIDSVFSQLPGFMRKIFGVELLPKEDANSEAIKRNAKSSQESYRNYVENRDLTQFNKLRSELKKEKAISVKDHISNVKKLETREEKINYLNNLRQEDPDIYKDVFTELKDQMEVRQGISLNSTEKRIKSLGVTDGSRAEYIKKQLDKLETREEKVQYVTNLQDKKLLTTEVFNQLKVLLNQ